MNDSISTAGEVVDEDESGRRSSPALPPPPLFSGETIRGMKSAASEDDFLARTGRSLCFLSLFALAAAAFPPCWTPSALSFCFVVAVNGASSFLATPLLAAAAAATSVSKGVGDGPVAAEEGTGAGGGLECFFAG